MATAEYNHPTAPADSLTRFGNVPAFSILQIVVFDKPVMAFISLGRIIRSNGWLGWFSFILASLQDSWFDGDLLEARFGKPKGQVGSRAGFVSNAALVFLDVAPSLK